MSTPAPNRNAVGTQPPVDPPPAYAVKEFHVRAWSPDGFQVTVVLRDQPFEVLEKGLEQLKKAGFTPAGR